MSATRRRIGPLPFVALLVAWLVPGAGHVYLGRLTRGIVLFVTITAVFWAGVAVGGVLTVDHYHERWWFVAQMFAGIHGVVGWYRQQQVYETLSDEPGIGLLAPPGTPEGARQESMILKKLAKDRMLPSSVAGSVSRVYAGVAGLLNLMCIFDAVVLALMGRTGEQDDQPGQEPAPAS